jgi:peroxiredoxin 2/4
VEAHPVPIEQYSDGPARIDEPAPDFEGRSTHGHIELGDFAGKWLVFFAHPADFTPVCASEFVAFARHAQRFAELNCSLLGLSVDSIYSHLAWRESIRERFGVSIDFPILEDVSMQIARRYDMIQARNAQNAVRALFVIDPHGVVRAKLHYPVSVGRSVSEVLRLVEALQTTDRLKVLAPEGWTPGEHTIAPPPQTVAEMDARRTATGDLTFGCVDWYYYKRPGTGETARARQEL